MDQRRVQGVGGSHDSQPRVEEAGLCEALGETSPPCSRHRRAGGVQKKGGFAAELEKVRARLLQDTAVEIWFQDEALRWSEEQDHAPVGQARDTSISAARSTHHLDLHIRRDLPGARQGRRACPAVLQYRSDGSCPEWWCRSRLAISDLRLGLGCNIQPTEITDDRRYDEPAGACGKAR